MGQFMANFASTTMAFGPSKLRRGPIGGLCAGALRFVVPGEPEKIGLEELLLRHALEMAGGDAPRESAASGVMMIPVPQSGILEKVEGQEEARATTGVTGLEITARIHDYIAAWPEGSSYLGFLFATRRGAGRSRKCVTRGS